MVDVHVDTTRPFNDVFDGTVVCRLVEFIMTPAGNHPWGWCRGHFPCRKDRGENAEEEQHISTRRRGSVTAVSGAHTWMKCPSGFRRNSHTAHHIAALSTKTTQHVVWSSHLTFYHPGSVHAVARHELPTQVRCRCRPADNMCTRVCSFFVAAFRQRIRAHPQLSCVMSCMALADVQLRVRTVHVRVSAEKSAQST